MNNFKIAGVSELQDAITSVLHRVASSKTKKYFVGLNDFNTHLADMLTTVDALAEVARGASIQVDGMYFSLGDYIVPKNMVDVIHAGTVYANEMAARRGVQCGRIEVSSSHGRVLTPAEFNGFFTDFNSNQDEGHKIELTQLTSGKLLLTDCRGLEDGDGWSEFIPGARVSEMVGIIRHISNPLSGVVPILGAYKKEEVAAWLLNLTL